jgi:hypothetical protein
VVCQLVDRGTCSRLLRGDPGPRRLGRRCPKVKYVSEVSYPKAWRA